MSIIHDALKRVQRNLSSKAGEIPVNQPANDQKKPGGLFEAPPPIEAVTEDNQQIEVIAPQKNKIKSILALICAIVITAVSVWYIYLQFRNHIPQAQRFARKSFYKLILHQEEVPEFKTKSPAELKPLAQLVINSPASTTSNTTQAAAPLITLNVHGIMSNTTGNVALINDHVYQEGDDVDGAKIIKINLDSITVNINGTEKTIFVKN